MAGQGSGVTVDTAPLDGALARLAAALSHPDDIMDAIGRYLVGSTHRRFERERARTARPGSRAPAR